MAAQRDDYRDIVSLGLVFVMLVLFTIAANTLYGVINERYSVVVEYRDVAVRGADSYRIDGNMIIVEKDGVTYTASLPTSVGPANDPKYGQRFALIITTSILLVAIIVLTKI